MAKILIVDDSPVVRNFHMSILKTEGYIVDGAEDGLQALEKALMQEYDLILCDINMENMDGLTFLKKYRDEIKETPVIIISTQSEDIHKKKAYALGANLYIVKPVKPDDLKLHIKMLLGQE